LITCLSFTATATTTTTTTTTTTATTSRTSTTTLITSKGLITTPMRTKTTATTSSTTQTALIITTTTTTTAATPATTLMPNDKNVNKNEYSIQAFLMASHIFSNFCEMFHKCLLNTFETSEAAGTVAKIDSSLKPNHLKQI